MITELFYSHILNMNGDSLYTRNFRRIHLFVFRYRLTKNGFADPKSWESFSVIFNEAFLSDSTGRFTSLQVLFLWSLLAATSLSLSLCVSVTVWSLTILTLSMKMIKRFYIQSDQSTSTLNPSIKINK